MGLFTRTVLQCSGSELSQRVRVPEPKHRSEGVTRCSGVPRARAEFWAPPSHMVAPAGTLISAAGQRVSPAAAPQRRMMKHSTEEHLAPGLGRPAHLGFDEAPSSCAGALRRVPLVGAPVEMRKVTLCSKTRVFCTEKTPTQA